MIWLVGCRGMLGREVSRVFRADGLPLIETDAETDFTSSSVVDSFCAAEKPAWIINCAAYTAVDRAESEPEKAALLNVTGPANLARSAAVIGARLIHVSTDYVFGDHGLTRPLAEEDPTGPESVYGCTKLSGEKAVRDGLKEHFIVRTSWLYGAAGRNFVFTMLDLMRERKEIRVVDDQWGTPTRTNDLADLFLRIVGSDIEEFGTYHYSNEGQVSWFGFAQEIQKQAVSLGILKNTCLIHPCASSDYPAPAKRPSWSVYSKDKVKASFGISVPPWRESLGKFLERVKESS